MLPMHHDDDQWTNDDSFTLFTELWSPDNMSLLAKPRIRNVHYSRLQVEIIYSLTKILSEVRNL